jgi:EF-P beta-lysylation protein EpmB
MIAQIAMKDEIAPWQRELQRAVTRLPDLAEMLELPLAALPVSLRAHADFPLRVPRGYVQRMRKGDPGDPLLRQVLPDRAEDLSVAGFGADPVGDSAAEVVPGLLHKYAGRVLLVTTGACAIHCRYCFRRHFPYASSNPAAGQWQRAVDYIRGNAGIGEVILSGGDPLSLSDERLAALVQSIEAIAHVRRLRIHTRMPIVLPERIDANLLAWLNTTHLKIVVVVHANHANEIDDSVRAAIADLRAASATVLNQSVLLNGVNDNAKALAELSEALFDAGVLPYYLHMLDRVAGAAHFEVAELRALAILQELRAQLPGYLLPRLVRESAGQAFKQPVGERDI